MDAGGAPDSHACNHTVDVLFALCACQKGIFSFDVQGMKQTSDLLAVMEGHRWGPTIEVGYHRRPCQRLACCSCIHLFEHVEDSWCLIMTLGPASTPMQCMKFEAA